MKDLRIIIQLMLCLAGLFFQSAMAKIQTHQNILCVFDPIGSNGPIYQKMQDYAISALEWGSRIKLKAYTDERVAADDFKAGHCDGVVLTGFQGRQFNSFTGTLDSVGAIPSYQHLKTALVTLMGSKAARLMRQGEFEVVGLYPAGAAYLYVSDRSIDSVAELAGKRFAVLDSDPAQKQMVLKLGAAPVASNVATMYSKFNNGAVDVVFGPAIVYQAMELHKGLEPQGGVIEFPIGQLTMQVIVRHDRFVEGFGQRSRDFTLASFEGMLSVAKSSEADIAEELWMSITKQQRLDYMEVLRQARIAMRNQGYYDAKMLSVLRKVRCQSEPTAYECSADDRE